VVLLPPAPFTPSSNPPDPYPPPARGTLPAFLYSQGQSFHFAPRFSGETFRESIVRHEYALSSRLGLKPGMKVLDAGCGVGGPARNIARFSGAHITGVTINDFQVARATLKAKNEGLSAVCEFQQGDFTKLKHADNSFDAAFSIEATCHSPERIDVFAEIFRVLKPGAVFGSYEWVMTPKFDPSNKHHIEIKRGIEIGDSLPDLVTQEECLAAFKAAGFEIVEAVDLAEQRYSPVPWFEPFLSHFRFENFKSRPLGLIISHGLTAALEFLHVAPKGTTLIHKHLWTATKTLNLGGQLGIFTPMLFVKVRKPLTAGAGAVDAKAAPSGATRRTGK